MLKQLCEAIAASEKPVSINFNFPGYEQTSPIAKIPLRLVSQVSCLTFKIFFSNSSSQSFIGPKLVESPKKEENNLLLIFFFLRPYF